MLHITRGYNIWYMSKYWSIPRIGGVGSVGHTGQHLPGGVIGLEQSGLAQNITLQSKTQKTRNYN